MPWNDDAKDGEGKKSGPWGAGTGPVPPSEKESGPKSPWGSNQNGSGPRRPPQNNGDQGADLDEVARRLREQFRNTFGGGGGNGGGRGPGRGSGSGNGSGGGMGGGELKLDRRTLTIAAALLGVGWLATGVYVVDAGEQGVVTRFGKFTRVSTPGIHMHFPSPIEAVEKVNTQRVNQIEIGDVDPTPAPAGTEGAASNENLMLTGDENIVDIGFQVFWQVSDAPQFLFSVTEPETTVRKVAEAAMREAVGRSQLASILTGGRLELETQTRTLIQKTLDTYGIGVRVTQVNLRRADPPSRVITAFREVAAASQEAETLVNQATTYKNQVVPQAQGEAIRFNRIYSEYRLAPDVTRQRLYLETLERVYERANKVIVDAGSNGKEPMIVLPPDLLKGSSQQSGAAPSAGPSAPTPPQGTGDLRSDR